MTTLLDATNNSSSSRDDEKPTHYANVKIATINDNGDTVFENVGKYGVGLLASRDVDAYIAEVFENNPDDIQYLDVRLEIRSATPVKRTGKIVTVIRDIS